MVAIVVIGFSVSLSVFFFLDAAMRRQPAFDRATVMRLGPAAATLFFALCGPVLVLREGLPEPGGGSQRRRPRWPLTVLGLAAIWATLVGIVAVETGRLIAIA